MDRRVSVVAVAVLLAAPAVARADDFVTRPYLQHATDHSVTIMWENDHPRAGTVTVEGATGTRTLAVAESARVELVVDGLAPSARYRYHVHTEDDDARGELTTAPVPGSPVPLSFVVYGDTRSSTGSHRQLVERVQAEVPDFLLGTGDMVDEGVDRKEWQEFFEIEGPLLADNVLYPALGNHDRQGRARSAEAYRARFALPDDGPDPERVYAFTYGPARFVILDSNSTSFALTDQTAWLERELAAARQDPTIGPIFVAMHHPPFSISIHGGQRDLRERWTPLFEKYDVTAVFSGHDHCYERAEVGGVHYFVSGGGGAALYPRSRRPADIDVDAIQRFERVNHYLRVHVVGARVEVTAIRVDGTPIETITWGDAPAAGAPSAPAAIAPTVAAATLAPRRVPVPARRGLPILAMLAVAGLVIAAAAALARARRS